MNTPIDCAKYQSPVMNLPAFKKGYNCLTVYFKQQKDHWQYARDFGISSSSSALYYSNWNS